MAKAYSPIENAGKKQPAYVERVRSIPRVKKLEATSETYEQITELASRGYSTRSIAYMLGATTEMFEVFRDEHQDEVIDAINLGRAIDETECITVLRATAVNPRASNANAAMKLYGELNFGWSGKSSTTGNKDLPRSISFTMIEPTDVTKEHEETD